MADPRVFINGARCVGCNIDLRLGEGPKASFEVSKAEWVQSDLPDPYRMPVYEQLDVVVEQDTPPPTDPALRRVRLVGWRSFKALLRQMRDIFLWEWRTSTDPEYAKRPGIAQLNLPMILTTIEYEFGTSHLVVRAEGYASFLERRMFVG